MMVKVILMGSQQTQWNIGNRYLPGGTTVDMTEEEIKKYKDVVIKVNDADVLVEVVEKPKKVTATKKKVTK